MIAVLWISLALAQDTVRATQPLELGDAYRTAREQSPRTAAARALADAVRARAASARRPPDPQVQFGFMNYTLPGLRSMDVIGMKQLQAMQMVPVAGQLGLAGRVANALAGAQAERSRDTEWDVRAKVAMAFYDLYAADRSLSIDRETLRLLQDILGITEAMYRVGDGRQADVLRAQLEIARMVQDTLRMTAMRTAMAARFNALLDLPADAIVGTPVLPAFTDSVPRVDASVRAAIADRPMLRAGERDLEAATVQAQLIHREIWPDVTIGLQYAQRSGMDGTERMGSLMVGATLPVFARSRQFRMRGEAAAMLQMSRAELRTMRAETQAAVVEAHSNVVRARNVGTLYRSTILPQAEAAVASALAAYRVGAVDFMTLLDNRMSLNRYYREFVGLEADEGKAWAELEMLLGRELFNAQSSARPVVFERK